MKLLLTLFFIAAMALPAHAQTDSSTSTQKVDARIMFQSEVRQLTSYLKENNESAAEVMFKEVTTSMESFIKETEAAIDKASGSEKRKLKGKLDRQRQLLGQFKSFQSNLIRNRPSIETWANQFIETLYN